MSKTLKTLFSLRRGYTTVAVEKRKVESIVRNVGGKESRKEVFWMRDPKTGNWIPETHFGETDVADLRHKFLTNKKDQLHMTSLSCSFVE